MIYCLNLQIINFKFGIEICEDLWAIIPPSSEMSIAGASVFFNLSASNEILGKSEYRSELVKSHSAKTISAYFYSSSSPNESSTDLTYSSHLLGASNGIILDESRKFEFKSTYLISEVDIEKLSADRRILKTYRKYHEKRFREIVFEINTIAKSNISIKPSKTPFVPNDSSERFSTSKEILDIQSTALAKRIRHIGIKTVTLGVSGGLDSTLALIVASRAFEKLNLDKSNINALVLPGPGSSNDTQANAKDLALEINASYKQISITKSVELHLRDIDHLDNNYDITYENAQARERTQILMDYANKTNGIVIGTGDLSELALGWCTYNADQISMYGVNSGVPKTLVKYLIEFESKTTKNQNLSKILQKIIDTPISPELIPVNKEGKISQKTEEIIGPYILHDFFLYYFLRYGFSPAKIFYLAMQSFDEFESSEILDLLHTFTKRFFNSQFKRNLMPDGIKVGSLCLSPRGDWRMPSDASGKVWLDEIEKLKKII